MATLDKTIDVAVQNGESQKPLELEDFSFNRLDRLLLDIWRGVA